MSRPRTAWPSPVAVALLAAGVLACALGGLAAWVGAAAIVTVLPELRAQARLRPGWSRLRAALPAIVVGTACIVLFRELLLGHPPASRDHGIHYFQTRLLVDDFLRHGQFTGWSDRFNDGYPFLESYPVLGYVVTGASHLLTFGAVSLRTSYAWGILLVWATGIAAVWWLAQAVARELEASPEACRWAGAAAALVFVFDAGESRQGGWTYAMFHGVWPQMFSASLWALSLPATLCALRRPSPRRIALAAAVLAASVLAHPFGMLAAATSAGGWLVALVLARPDDGLTSGRFKVWALVHAGAAALSGGWVATFLGSADAMAREPVPWVPLGSLAIDAIRGALLTTQLPWAGALALIGGYVVVRRPRVAGVLLVGLLAILIVLGSHAAITVLRLDLLVSGFKNLQFPRYAIELKPLLFALAGVGASQLGSIVARDGNGADASAPPATSRRRRFTLALVLSPLLVAAVQDAGRLVTRPVGALDTLENSAEGRAEPQLLAALREDAARSDQPLRVAFMREGMGGGTYPLFSITDAGADLVIDGHVPTVNFKHRLSRRPAGYDALGVTHVIHDEPLRATEPQLAAQLEPIGTFGAYELARWSAEDVPAPRARTRSGAALDVEVLDTESWNIEVGPEAAPASIVLARAPHVRWTATLDGAQLPTEVVRITPGVSELAIEVPKAGVVQLRYRRSRLERIAAGVGWVALVVVGIALFRGSPLPLADRLLPAPRRRAYEVLALAVTLAVLGLAWRRQQSQLATTWNEAATELVDARNRGRFEDDLVLADDVDVRTDPPRVCDGLMGKSTLPGCSEADHRPHRSMLHRDPYLYRCLEVTVPPAGTTTLGFETDAAQVLGMLLRVTGEGRGKGLTYDLGDGVRRVGRDLRTFALPRGEGTPTLELQNSGTIPERVCVAAAAFSG